MGQVKFCDLKPCGVCEKRYSSSDMFNEEICKFCVENIRDLLNLLRFSTQENLDENINRLIDMVDKETRRNND